MEALGTMAGGVAHDLNNILSGIVGYPELLLSQLPADSPMRRYIINIQKSGEKAAAVVQDLLAITRRGVIVSEIFNLNETVLEYLSSPEHQQLQEQFPGVRFIKDLDPKIPNISGSGIHLSKTLMNLVTNAAESIEITGQVIIKTEHRYINQSIRGYDRVAKGEYVILRVSDNGRGIHHQDIERIFEPFYTKKKMGRSGTGLGMALVWGTVKDHKGYIDVSSRLNEGTVFTLYFPITHEKAELKAKTAPLEKFKGNAERILIIDDMEDQRDLASQLLSFLGYQVETATSGEKGLELLRERSFDLILLDMIMESDMDGLETFRKVLEINPSQRAIIASGFSENARVKEALDIGAGAYLKKPYTLEAIGLAVRKELYKVPN
jgi:CheY-like chemotaxis protein